MKKIATVLAASVLMISGIAFSGHASAVKTMICPACKMKMTTVKSAGAPVAVPIKGTTYYCCSACAAGKAHMKPKGSVKM